MSKRIVPLVLIFICTSIAWVILGGANLGRTYSQDTKLKQQVGQLWGAPQRQAAPVVYYRTREEQKVVRTMDDGKNVTETSAVMVNHYLNLEASDIKADLKLSHRRKGLLWYSTYEVRFDGNYTIANSTSQPREVIFEYTFPSSDGIFDDFIISVGGRQLYDATPVGGKILARTELAPNDSTKVRVAYRSQGLDQWWYVFGADVSQVRNFSLAMSTDFKRVDFPENSISPTSKTRKGGGWELAWKYTSLISGIQIGIEMPKKLNPGPFVGKVSFFAPVSLFLFLFLMFIVTAIRGVRIHPMNYFFVCAAFFAFHLLLAYLVDHMDLHLAFAISSAVSVLLVVSYMRLVTGMRFALVEVGLSQLFYLVLFSYSFFLEGYTGLAVTIACVLTLFVLMQATGRLDWEKLAAQENIK